RRGDADRGIPAGDGGGAGGRIVHHAEATPANSGYRLLVLPECLERPHRTEAMSAMPHSVQGQGSYGDPRSPVDTHPDSDEITRLRQPGSRSAFPAEKGG